MAKNHFNKPLSQGFSSLNIGQTQHLSEIGVIKPKVQSA